MSFASSPNAVGRNCEGNTNKQAQFVGMKIKPLFQTLYVRSMQTGVAAYELVGRARRRLSTNRCNRQSHIEWRSLATLIEMHLSWINAGLEVSIRREDERSLVRPIGK